MVQLASLDYTDIHLSSLDYIIDLIDVVLDHVAQVLVHVQHNIPKIIDE